MNDSENIKLKTWQLLQDEMSPEEVAEFLDEMAKDQDVSETVAEQVVRHAARVNLKEKLQRIHLETQRKSRPNRRWYSIAAVILVLFLPFLYWQIVESQNVYQNYFEPYRSSPAARGDTSRASMLWINSMITYNDQEFEESIGLLEELIQIKKKPVYQFYLAVSYMSLAPPQIDNAIPILEEIVLIENQLLLEQTRWYLALAYWKNDQFSEAKSMFTIVSETDEGFRQKEAKKILKLWDN